MKYGRRDANHKDLIADYRALGCSVADTADLGKGVPDCFVGCAGVTDPVEFKADRGKLRDAQREFSADWRGSKIWVIKKRDDVIAHVNDMRNRACTSAKRS